MSKTQNPKGRRAESAKNAKNAKQQPKKAPTKAAPEAKKAKKDPRGAKKGPSKKELEEKKQRRWVLIVTICTFFSTIIITYISDTLLANANLIVSMLILVFIILFGIVSDVIGVAITATTPEPFNAMAAKKIPGAKTAVQLIKNAPRMSNVLNDVVGDICGIVSGATGVAIGAQLIAAMPDANSVILTLVLSGLVAAATVAGKAVGKDLAMSHSVQIVFGFARVISTFKKIFGVRE